MAHTVVQDYQKKFIKNKVPVLKPGMTVKVTHKFREGDKERSQLFQGVIIKMHEKTSHNATFTVRKIVDGIGVEKIFPLHSPMVEVEVARASKVRRSKLYYLRDLSGKATRLKEWQKDFGEVELEGPTVVEAPAKAEPKEEAVEATETPVEATEAPAAEEAKVEETKAEEVKEDATTEEKEEKKD